MTTASLLQNTDFNLNVSMDVKRNPNFVIIGQPLRATPNEELPSIYVEKIQNGGCNSQKSFRVPFLLQWTDFWREGRVISCCLANRFGSPFGTNTKLLRGVIGSIFTPNDYLNTVFNEVVSQLPGSCENNALSRSPREKLQLVTVLSLRVKCLVLSTRKKYMLFKDRPVK